jgi:hypothetical protein
MAASYPTSIKSFLTYQNQPGDANHIVPDPSNPAQTVDLTYDRAKVTNEIHDEVIAIEQTMGMLPPQPMGNAIFDLYFGKSPGIADPVTGAVPPAPPPSHNHGHQQIAGRDADDHPQYMRVDGARGFSAAVSAPDAWWSNQLITLEQGQGSGLNSSQVNSVIQTALANASTAPMTGPAPQRYRMTGGFLYGYTNASGNIYVDYSAANFAGILTFVYMKNPHPGGSHYGYVYQYQEDQLALLSISNQGAWIQFIEDIVVDRQALVAMTWIAVGV